MENTHDSTQIINIYRDSRSVSASCQSLLSTQVTRNTSPERMCGGGEGRGVSAIDLAVMLGGLLIIVMRNGDWTCQCSNLAWPFGFIRGSGSIRSTFGVVRKRLSVTGSLTCGYTLLIILLSNQSWKGLCCVQLKQIHKQKKVKTSDLGFQYVVSPNGNVFQNIVRGVEQ